MNLIPDGSLKEVLNLIEQHQQVFVLSHTNPDADAYGSSCGLAAGLRAIGKEVSVFNESPASTRYSVIPGAMDVLRTLPVAAPINTLLIVCDCGAAERVGDSFLPFLKSAPVVLNIDHHTSNSMFGMNNLVIETSSSTSEIIFELLSAIERNRTESDSSSSPVITHDAAVCLLAGIIGDTGSFRYSCTTPNTFLAAYELCKRGAKPAAIVQELFATVSLPAVRVQSEAMSKIELHNEGRFAEVVVTQEMIVKCGADLADADSLGERARDVAGVLISALYKQDVDMWRVSLRSRSPEWDVSIVARHFGGGGHKPAAAFRWRRDLATLQSELRVQVSELLSRA